MSEFESQAQTARKLLGTDFKIKDNRFVVAADGDLAFEDGRDCLGANLTDVVYSNPFERIRHPDWGVGLEEWVSESLFETKRNELVDHISRYLYKDSRVKKVHSVEIRQDGTIPRKFWIEASIEPVDGQPLLNLVWPFNMEVI